MSDWVEDDLAADADAAARRDRLDAAVQRGARIAFWAILQFAVSFAEQVAEVLAPLLFVAGLGWAAVLRVAAGLSFDSYPALQGMVVKLPNALTVGDWWLTPGGLIEDGLLLMALVAACRTATAIIAKET
jgi:hypothetical protein